MQLGKKSIKMIIVTSIIIITQAPIFKLLNYFPFPLFSPTSPLSVRFSHAYPKNQACVFEGAF